MKAHEETWWFVRETVEQAGDPPHVRVAIDMEITPFLGMAKTGRGQLASQAPAMARLLLKAIHPEPTGNEWGCLGCQSWEEGKHLEGCELVALLNAAGVLP